jgi:5-methylthioadenosine/S-adenosylhomocysteine deaminase
VGLGEWIGGLMPGRRADIIVVDLTGPRTQPVHDLAAILVLTLDVPGVIRELEDRLPALVDRSHGRRVQEYDT